MGKKWVVAAKKADFNKIAHDFNISPYLARIIRNRGPVTDEEIDTYLNGDLSHLHDPAQLRDMDLAASITEEAIEAQIHIRIVGDYDIDGVCASFILKKGIERAGGIIDVRLPERIKDGYGLNENIIRAAYDDGVELIITCDNGIAAAKETELAMSLGMRVIVTDHHEVPYEETGGERRQILPMADAVIDPKRDDCPYPFKGICGGMVAYKFISYLYEHTGIGETVSGKDELMKEFLAFAAFATVGDIMELVDENRVAVRYGLKLLKDTSNVGMNALIDATGTKRENLSVYQIGFVLGPCINASGRLETADAALDLFLEEDKDKAAAAAQELVKLNISRKNMTMAFTNKAVRMTEESFANDRVLVIYMPECHESLAGIVAGKLREHFDRPAIVLTDDADGNIKGSGRSTAAYDMYAGLNRVSDLFTKFGGHKMAAGLSLPAGSADELRRRLNENCTLSLDELAEKAVIDIPLPIGYVTDEFVRELDKLEPCGTGNPRPLFAQKDIPVRSVQLPSKNVLKLVLEGRDGAGNVRIYEAVSFKDCERMYEELKDRKTVSLLYQVGFNEYMGEKKVQLQIRDYAL